MSITFFGAAFDSSDAARAAQFWATVLDRKVADGATEDDAVVEPGPDPSSGPRLAFHKVAETKGSKNRFHPDLIATDYEGEIERLIALGARKLNAVEGAGARWTTLADVDGNEFDLIAG